MEEMNARVMENEVISLLENILTAPRAEPPIALPSSRG